MQHTADGGSRLDVLDGLRGLAIVLVLIYHGCLLTGFKPALQLFGVSLGLRTIGDTGFIGVSLFFFISGFCLFYPYARHCLEGARRPTLRHYAWRRFIKIVPSYVIALTAMAIIFHGDFKTFGDLARNYALHLAFLHWFGGPEAFSAISGPFWTLAIEVEFYVIFPLIALAMMRAPLLTFLAAGLYAIWYRYSLTGVHDGHFYYVNSLQAHIDTFVTGMLAAYFFVRLRSTVWMGYRWVRAGATVAAVAAFTTFVLLLHQLSVYGNLSAPWNFYRWDISHRVAMELLFFTITLGTLFAWREWHALVANRVLVWFSLVSYNLYLWHDGILVSCHDFGMPCNSGPTAWMRIPNWPAVYFITATIMSIAVGSLLTYYVERPLLRTEPRDWAAWARAVAARLRPVHEATGPT